MLPVSLEKKDGVPNTRRWVAAAAGATALGVGATMLLRRRRAPGGSRSR
jgi:hypothetical protein